MADTEDTPQTERVDWRLPTRIASHNDGDWTALREHLAAWVEGGCPLKVEGPDATKNCCLSMPSPILRALEKKARQLAEEHGKRYTPGYVARLVWDLWEPS